MKIADRWAPIVAKLAKLAKLERQAELLRKEASQVLAQEKRRKR